MTTTTAHPQTGLKAYDTARFSEWLPLFERVALGGPIQRLMQVVPAGATGNNDTHVPPQNSLGLLFWRSGAPDLICRIGGEAFRSPIEPWNYLVLPSGADSWWVSSPTSAHEVCHMHIDLSFLTRVAFEDCRAGAATGLPPRVDASDMIMSAIAQAIMDEPANSPRLMWDTMATALALRLFRIEQNAIVMPQARGGLAARTTKLVIDYIEDHLNEDVSLVELAELAGLSQFHLCRAFKQATGLPPHRYQIKLRVERAKELLEASSLPISEIALAVGYDDQGQLARLFRKEVGTTPSQYRRDRQN